MAIFTAKVFLFALVFTVSISILFYISLYPLQGNHNIEIKPQSCQKIDEKLNKTLFFDKIYVIHLEYRVDRKERMTKLFKQHNLDYSFFPAIDANSSEVETYYQQNNGTLHKAAIACWLSHLKVYQTIVDNRFQNAIIFEDDVDMEMDIAEQLRDITQFLPRYWEMLYVGHCSIENLREPYNHPNLYISTRPSCTHAYAVSFIGAWLLLHELAHIVFPIDVELVQLIEPGKIKSFSIEPPLASQWRDGIPSDVSEYDPLYIPYYLKNSTLRYLNIIEYPSFNSSE
ncbi:13820_t:CDS:1 [Funneliformis geosporum]|uniref:11901_t:CDS:1 n=1 Tax=Funneliformis geosporum TaxID=1117311 RepID=A0A9W4SUD1_9GLOM|nr:13820_t:CDS:1 [Funneliformis geosporum]CAI2181667.1 11901_t:CDS:1 [Funneliformis geosporum]